MITALLVLYAACVLLGLVSACLAWYNSLNYGTRGKVTFMLVMTFIPFVNILWAFIFVVFLTFGSAKDW